MYLASTAIYKRNRLPRSFEKMLTAHLCFRLVSCVIKQGLVLRGRRRFESAVTWIYLVAWEILCPVSPILTKSRLPLRQSTTTTWPRRQHRRLCRCSSPGPSVLSLLTCKPLESPEQQDFQRNGRHILIGTDTPLGSETVVSAKQAYQGYF